MKHSLFNIKIDLLNKPEVLSRFEEYRKSDKCNSIYFFNAHCFNIAQKNEEYLNAINVSDLLLNDGIGIKIACKMAGLTTKENMNGTDLIPDLIKLASTNRKKVFLLGGVEGIASKAKENITVFSPEIIIAGACSGYFNEKEEAIIIDKINNSRAEILILGMGVPKQELWASNNMSKLSEVKVIIAGGAILDFMAGKFSRAPKFIRRIGFEWLYRLSQEPRRLASRYFIGNIKFLWTISWYLAINKYHN